MVEELTSWNKTLTLLAGGIVLAATLAAATLAAAYMAKATYAAGILAADPARGKHERCMVTLYLKYPACSFSCCKNTFVLDPY